MWGCSEAFDAGSTGRGLEEKEGLTDEDWKREGRQTVNDCIIAPAIRDGACVLLLLLLTTTTATQTIFYLLSVSFVCIALICSHLSPAFLVPTLHCSCLYPACGRQAHKCLLNNNDDDEDNN